MAKTAAQLMEEAKKLMDQAKRIEEAAALKIGKHVMSNINTITLEQLRAYVKSIVDGGEPQQVKGKQKSKKEGGE